MNYLYNAVNYIFFRKYGECKSVKDFEILFQNVAYTSI